MKPLRNPLCLSLMLLGVSGCSILGSEQRDPVTIYSPDIRVSPEADWPSVPWTLVIAKPTAARVVDSPRISVRPVPGELQVYRGATWAQPATDLLQDAIQRTLEDSGRIGAVASADAGILGDYKLVMDLRRFEADYAGAATPSAVVEVSAKLVYNRDQRVVASRTFLSRQPANGVDIPQVAAAFEQALTASTRDIAGWVLQTGHGDTPRKR
jgi:cholesterol transport system auxiliary component